MSEPQDPTGRERPSEPAPKPVAGTVASPLEAAWGQNAGFGMQITSLSLTGTIMNAIIFVAGVVVLVGYAAGFTYLRRLAWRIPSPRLARHSSIVMYGLVISRGVAFLVGGLLALLAAIQSGATGGGVEVVAGVIYVVGGLTFCSAMPVTLVFGIWAIVLLVMFRIAFSAAAYEARSTWAAG